jgi:hypothetical protein
VLAAAPRVHTLLLSARGRCVGPSTRLSAEQVLEPVHQPRLEPAPTHVHVLGDGGCEVLTVPEPVARDAEAGGHAGQAVDHSGSVLLVLLKAVEAGVERTEATTPSLTASAASVVGPRRWRWRRDA